MPQPLVVAASDPWWLLQLKIGPGEFIPFHYWLVFAHQLQTSINAELPA